MPTQRITNRRDQALPWQFKTDALGNLDFRWLRAREVIYVDNTRVDGVQYHTDLVNQGHLLVEDVFGTVPDSDFASLGEVLVTETIWAGTGDGGPSSKRAGTIDGNDATYTVITASDLTNGVSSLAFDELGVLWASLSASGVTGTPHTLVSIDTADGTVATTVGDIEDESSNPMWITSIARHPLTGVLWCGGFVTQGAPDPEAGIYTLDTDTGVVTQVFDQQFTYLGDPISFDEYGNLYQSFSNGSSPQLLYIDQVTGAATVIGSTAAWFRAFEWCSSVQRFFATDGGDGPLVYLLNPVDGTSSVQGTPTGAARIASLAIR